jgi:hypothetical protein
LEVEKLSEEFYNKCAELLGVEYDCQPFPWPNYKRTRWNNRAAGSGRYPGYGIIRKFGSQIHVALSNPISHHGIYNSEEEVFIFLRNLEKSG